jgi:hypothetical protein
MENDYTKAFKIHIALYNFPERENRGEISPPPTILLGSRLIFLNY